MQIPDIALHELKSHYLRYSSEWCAVEGFDLSFPTLRQKYYGGDSWIEPIRYAELPTNVTLRHRLWTSIKDARGLVDLIVSPASASDERRLREACPAGALVQPFSKGKGIQISMQVPEMRQASGFDPNIASKAFETMRTLVHWYLAHHA